MRNYEIYYSYIRDQEAAPRVPYVKSVWKQRQSIATRLGLFDTCIFIKRVTPEMKACMDAMEQPNSHLTCNPLCIIK